MPFNQPAAMADFAYWAAMGHWALDESVALLLGREPSKASWGAVYTCVKVSDFARQFERLRNLALRAPELAYGQHAVEPVKVIAWATDVGHPVPLELATAVAARETKRLSRNIAVLKGNVVSQEPLAQTEAAAGLDKAAAAKPAGESASISWGFVFEDLKDTPGQRAKLLLEYMRSLRAKVGDAVPSTITIGGRSFEVSDDLMQRLELLPNIDVALLDATNPQSATTRGASRPEAATSVVEAIRDADRSPTVTHEVRRRADPLAAVIAQAKSTAADSNDWTSVWAALVVIAQRQDRPPPLLGYTEGEGVKYQSDRMDEPVAWLTREAWRGRARRDR